MRVSHLDESDTVAKRNDTKSCEGMTVVQTITVSVVVVGACSASLHHVVSAVMELKLLPKAINGQISVRQVLARSTRHSLDRHQRVASTDVSVVAVVLGKGLLDDDTPEGAVAANRVEDCRVLLSL